MSGNFAIKGGGRTPYGKCHLKFPFWFFEPVPKAICQNWIKQHIFHKKTVWSTLVGILSIAFAIGWIYFWLSCLQHQSRYQIVFFAWGNNLQHLTQCADSLAPLHCNCGRAVEVDSPWIIQCEKKSPSVNFWSNGGFYVKYVFVVFDEAIGMIELFKFWTRR